jgi:ATP-dependent Clp protease adapter protein ClpS
MPKIITVQKPAVQSDVKHEDIYEVILYNDDHNIAEFVSRCLQKVFGHSAELALKIMVEAHVNGRAIAEVEAKSEAILHKQQLESFGLTAAAEKI